MVAKVCFVLCVLVSAVLVAGHVLHIPPVRMDTGESTCPSDTNIDAVRDQLSKKISGLVQKIAACGGNGWKRVAFLDMKDPNQTCPRQWREYEEDSVRACGRPVGGASCNSVLFSTDGYAYTRVCGRVTGYQYASPDASVHVVHTPTPGNAINEPYLDGVSITHGNPRQHIWSLYAGNAHHCCEAAHINNMQSLGFIGNSSFCDTGNPDGRPWPGAFFTFHPLWEGDTQCAGSPTCCSSQAGPWFYASLDLPSIQDIEVRICADQDTGDEDIPVELVEIYVR